MKKTNQQTNIIIQLWTKNTVIVRKIDGCLGAIHGIGFTEFLVLHHLNAAPHLLLRRIDLAESLGRSASAITKMLNPMEKIGLVGKESNPRDARVSLVKLTNSGQETYQQASNTLNQLSTTILSKIDSIDADSLCDLLNGLDV